MLQLLLNYQVHSIGLSPCQTDVLRGGAPTGSAPRLRQAPPAASPSQRHKRVFFYQNYNIIFKEFFNFCRYQIDKIIVVELVDY